jgi:hypothetical protein
MTTATQTEKKIPRLGLVLDKKQMQEIKDACEAYAKLNDVQVMPPVATLIREVVLKWAKGMREQSEHLPVTQ